jgi:hypothetical protein
LEPLVRRLDVVSAEIDELAGQREATGSPADVIAARRAARGRGGQVGAVNHSVARDEKLHG